jgi:cell wall-associated NlpC family hydrolase
MAACAAAPAVALATKTAKKADAEAIPAGGATPGSTGTTNVSVSGGASPSVPAQRAKHTHHAPITARTPNIAYHGPVYEKTATGQIVPYTLSAPTSGTSTGVSSNASVSSTGGDTMTVPASTTGGSPVTTTGTTTGTAKPDLLVPGHTARVVDGLAAAPIDAPAAVQQIIWTGNQIVGLPYIYGGGHASFNSPGYDCSGTVSYALHGADLLSTPMDSTEFEGWGGRGVGTWVTIFANGGHAYMTVAGIRLDTSPANDPSGLEGPRWRPLRPENAGFVVRHPAGL